MARYKEYKKPDFTSTAKTIQEFWDKESLFEKSISTREGKPEYVFYEGPPSANGIPGIHHVMARTIKDIFCRYKTLKGFQVKRKAGWDTHGLPVEIGVEKKLGITKEDIGKSISIAEYNNECRSEVMKYKDLWDDLTVKMGYWLDLDNPYITFDNKYIETVWYLLRQLYDKNLLYKGYSIQPYSPAAGTGLSTHELNQPGCYKNVKDNTVVAQFKVVRDQQSEKLFSNIHGDLYILAWTTTPWTLPSNTALAMNARITYVLVKSYNPYTFLPQTVILAKDLFGKYFPEENGQLDLESYEPGQKQIPWQIISEVPGKEFEGVRFEQLLPYAQPEDGDAFKVLLDDFVTTEDGTGIVHIAPSFGADDFRVAKKYGVGSLTMVDKQGKFISEMGEFAHRYVKNEFDPLWDGKSNPVDVDIIIKLKQENKAFKTEKYEHSYPHCWRTDKPILYYPLDSWFIRTTAMKERMIELNNTINWKPASTGTGRFGNWLENLVDWNLSRSRYWGIPLPVWATEDREDIICIGSAEELYHEIEKSIAAGLMKTNPWGDYKPGNMDDSNYQKLDLHRPFVDEIILVSPTGKAMHREADLIDVWFDSGAMPYAQLHYPFENKDEFLKKFPADFIAEGVDQTRGWFFTLHAIATMVFDSVAFKTVISNGLVLDKNGNKMSKRLGNAVDPFVVIEKYGPDPVRWYMIGNAMPWDNLKFDEEGVAETMRKLFGTLYNTYAFFSLYANIDQFTYSETDIPYSERPEIDRWILSELNSLIKRSDENYADYEPTRVARDIQEFVNDILSNWYVRLSRRRFWKGEYSTDKISAYQTLYKCLETIAIISSPIAPFYSEQLFRDLNEVTKRHEASSVHLTTFPESDAKYIDIELEERMQLARQLSSMVLSLRKRTNIRVRQPLSKIIIPIQDKRLLKQIERVSDLIKTEVNVKEIEFLAQSEGFLVKTIKANFKLLGPKYGKIMKEVAAAIAGFTAQQITEIETNGSISCDISGQTVNIGYDEVEIITEDIPGWVVNVEGGMTVALDITITDTLREEGIAREFINRIQNIRKESGFEVTDRIIVCFEPHDEIIKAIQNNYEYICSEILADKIENIKDTDNHLSVGIEVIDNIETQVIVKKAE
jgi:isoleucyl-tRNA synthetase